MNNDINKQSMDWWMAKDGPERTKIMIKNQITEANTKTVLTMFRAETIFYHNIKTHPEPFKAVRKRIKNFEIRKNDKNYKVNDVLILEEYVPDGYFEDRDGNKNKAMYTGDALERKITYVLEGGAYGIEPGFVALGII